jgi:hypothetical protein
MIGRTHRHCREGFITLLGVSLIGMLALLVAGWTALIGHQHRRTERAEVQAQLRQMLRSAQPIIERRLAARHPVDVRSLQIDLPDVLAQRSSRLVVVFEPQDEDAAVHVRVEARLDERVMRQTLRYAASAAVGGWQPVAATLNPRPAP